MGKRTITNWVVLAACTAAAWPAHAGRPLQTEDAGVLERGACEVEAVGARLASGDVASRELALQLGCGIGASTQVALGWARVTEPGTSTRGLQLSGKTALWQAATPMPDGAPAALALAYGVASDRAAGERWRHAASEVNLVYSLPVGGDLTAHANLGHARDEIGQARTTTWGLALEHAGFGPWAPMAEFFGDDREAAWWNVGLRYTAVPEKVFLDASYGRQMNGDATRLVTVGLKFAF